MFLTISAVNANGTAIGITYFDIVDYLGRSEEVRKFLSKQHSSRIATQPNACISTILNIRGVSSQQAHASPAAGANVGRGVGLLCSRRIIVRLYVVTELGYFRNRLSPQY